MKEAILLFEDVPIDLKLIFQVQGMSDRFCCRLIEYDRARIANHNSGWAGS